MDITAPVPSNNTSVVGSDSKPIESKIPSRTDDSVVDRRNPSAVSITIAGCGGRKAA